MTRRDRIFRFAALNDAEWLREQYVVRGRGQREIAAEVGCCQPTVIEALRYHGIAARPGGRPRQHWQLHDDAWLRHHYRDLQQSAETVAAEIGCRANAVYVALRRFGIPAHQHHRARRLMESAT